MVFQELSIDAARAECKVSVPKKKSQKVTVNFEKYNIVFYDKQDPNITSFELVENESNCSLREFSGKIFTWLYLCYCNRFEQVYANISEMLLRLWQRQFNIQLKTISKAIKTYLPPLTIKVTDSETKYLYLKYFQGLPKEMDMPYVNVTLHVEAAINAYKLLANTPNSFPMLLSIFGIIHFEEIVY